MLDTMSKRDFLRLSALAVLGTALQPLSLARSALAMPAEAAASPKPLTLPRTEARTELAYLSVDEQIRRFKAGSLSPVDVLEAQIERIRQYNGPLNTTGEEPKDFMKFNGQVNAISYEHFEQARKGAQEAERRYRAGTARALEGITVAVKDENEVTGWRVSAGSLALKDAPLCEDNSAIIDMLLAEGAILHIQTTVPELYMHVQTWSRLWGVTRNPWNLHYGVGGSSGGSGAALAAGFTTLATGSDMGGSIRVPSSMCGVYGFKPPFGRVPTSEIAYETLGPMARTFDDLVRMQNVIAGPHPKVHASLRPKLVYPQTYDSLKGVRLAVDYFSSWLPEGVDAPVRKALGDAVEVLRGQGAIIEEVELGWQAKDIYEIFMNGLLSSGMGAMFLAGDELKNVATSYVASALAGMSSKGPGDMARADDLATKLHRQLQAKLFEKGCQALIMPTMMTTRLAADNDPATDTVPINGKPVKGIRFVATYIWNLLSRYPVVDVPVGIDGNNVPIGMQIVGNTFDDLSAFRVAYGYSRAGLRLYDRLYPDYRNRA